MKAIELFMPDGAATLSTYARSVVQLSVKQSRYRFLKRKRERPNFVSLVTSDGEAFEPPAFGKPLGGRIPMSPELRGLPSDLMMVVRLRHIDGFDLQEVGFLCGCSPPTVSKRLAKAAELLAEDGVVKPVRKYREKRDRGGARASWVEETEQPT